VQPAPNETSSGRPTPVSRPPLWPVLAAYLAAFLLALGASAAYVLVAAIPRAGGDPSRIAEEATRFALSAPGVLGSALSSALVLTTVALATARLMGRGVIARLRLGPTRARPLGVVAAVTGMAGLSLACGAAAELLDVGHGDVMEVVAHSLAAPSPGRLVLALLTIGLAPGLAEEAFFRGLMQTRLGARWGRWPAVLVTAAAFGLFHLDPVQGTLAFVAGIFLGWIVERFGGLRPSIAAHAINNAMFVLLASYGSPDEHATRAATVATLVGGLLACGVSIAVIMSRLGTAPAPEAATASISAS
jgi:membrane protease YdiL (CAAX protease family)